MEGNAPKSAVTGVPGWLTDAEESAIARYAAQLGKGETFVGIGVEYGRSMAAVAHAVPKGANITGVELYPKPEFEINMKEAKIQGVAILEGDSYTVGKAWDGGKIDLLFIDGDHTFEGAARDIEAWIPYLKVGGFVLFHDVAQPTNASPHYLHFEVTRAITSWLGTTSDFQAVEQVDSLAVFKRVGNTPAPKKLNVQKIGEGEFASVLVIPDTDPTLPLIETPAPVETEDTTVTPAKAASSATPAKNKGGRPAKKTSK